MYWQYVAEYAQAVTSSLRGVYDGNDYGLSAAPGFNETSLFRLHLNGPSQQPVNQIILSFSPRICSRTPMECSVIVLPMVRWGTPALFSRCGSLLLSALCFC